MSTVTINGVVTEANVSITTGSAPPGPTGPAPGPTGPTGPTAPPTAPAGDYEWDINGGVNFGPPSPIVVNTSGKSIRFRVDQSLFPAGISIGCKQQAAGQPTYEISISSQPGDFSGIKAQGNDEASFRCAFAAGFGVQFVLASNQYYFLNVRAVTSVNAAVQYLYR